MPIKGIQQFMLGSVMNNEVQTRDTLRTIRQAGYEGIELCSFMTHPTGLMVRLLTRAAGMPTGSGGKLDWPALVKESGLRVISLHTDLGSVARDPAAVAAECQIYGTRYAVITGMYRFDYGRNLAILLIFIAVSLVIGLLLGCPFGKLNTAIEKSKKKSGLIL